MQRALDDRADPWERVHQSAAPAAIQRTLQLADHVVATAARWAEEYPETLELGLSPGD